MAYPAVEYDDFNTEKSERLTKMIMKLFDHWKLTYAERSLMLGMSPRTNSTISRYKNGSSHFAPNRDLHERAAFFLSIHKMLRTIFPSNPKLAYAWPKAPNNDLGGRSPVQVIVEDGFLGLVDVHAQLENFKIF